MRRLLILSVALIVLFVLTGWLVLPMFVAPKESRLSDCSSCEALERFVPQDAPRVVVIPHGGTTLYELGRRLDPGEELIGALPPPGLIAIVLGDAPVVAWIEADGKFGAVAMPHGPRAMVARLAAHLGIGMRWSDGALTAGVVGDPSRSHDDLFARLRDRTGHLFAAHDLGFSDLSSVQSVGRLEARTLEVETFPDAPLPPTRNVGDFELAPGAVISIVTADITKLLSPVEKILPVRLEERAETEGQVVIYDLRTKAILPRIRGIIFVRGAADAKESIGRLFPAVRGVSHDSTRMLGGIVVHRRETLGVIVEAADLGDRLAVALDGSSLDRWAERRRLDKGKSVALYVEADVKKVAEAIEDLDRSPARYLLSRSDRRRMRGFLSLVRPFRTARRLEVRLTVRDEGQVIVSRVEW